ncbi:MAG: hypothetical protein AABM30_08840 [Actinomycetota bacterium]
MLRFPVTLAAIAAVSLPVGASGSPIQPQLNAKVSSRAISLTDAQGQRVKVLQQNSYRLVVKDSSTTQNFHLVGPRVDLKTKVSATGNRAWIANLRPGRYVYWSDRSTTLRGTFTVKPGPPPA